MSDFYCPSCFRTLRSADATCPACHPERRVPRAILLIGAAGAPLLIAGITTFNSRLSLAGGIISGVAAVAYAVLSLR